VLIHGLLHNMVTKRVMRVGDNWGSVMMLSSSPSTMDMFKALTTVQAMYLGSEDLQDLIEEQPDFEPVYRKLRAWAFHRRLICGIRRAVCIEKGGLAQVFEAVSPVSPTLRRERTRGQGRAADEADATPSNRGSSSDAHAVTMMEQHVANLAKEVRGVDARISHVRTEMLDALQQLLDEVRCKGGAHGSSNRTCSGEATQAFSQGSYLDHDPDRGRGTSPLTA
jgi:hypothetical protein